MAAGARVAVAIGVVKWVLFGWFEHTLSALVAIARNTGQQLPVSYDVPPAAYEQRR